MLPVELLSAPPGSRLDHCTLDPENLTVHLAIITPNATCPVCGSDARRIHSRYTRRLADLPCLGRAHESIGCALGGEAGSRLTARLSMTTSPDTLLRRVKQLKGNSAPSPRFVGIDDWAWRKGQRYGTIVVDLERGDIVDLLPDRDAETVKRWLGEHPGI